VEWEEFLRSEGELITLIGALGDPSIERAAFKLAFAKMIMPVLSSGTPLPKREVLDILEDLQLRLSEREANETLLQSGLAVLGDGELRMPERVSVTQSFVEKINTDALSLPRDRFLRLLDTRTQEKSSEGAFELTECAEAIDRTAKWALEIAAETRAAGLPGVPVFWNCEADTHTPFSPDPGTLTTGDTLLLLVERTRYGIPLPKLDEDDLWTVAWLWRQILLLQRHDHGWNAGAFNVPMFDDDFVGAFMPEHAQLGPCPTVDATGQLVLALATLLDSSLVEVTHIDPSGTLEQGTHGAIALGVDFLLRCQLEEGGWPIYRYENDHFSMPPRDLSCRFAVDGLSLAVRSGILGADRMEQVYNALRAYLTWVEKTARFSNGECHWVPNFTRPFAVDEEKVQATATIGLTLQAIMAALPDAAATIERLRTGAYAFIRRVWQPEGDRYARIAFRVPTWEGPSGAQFSWEIPTEPLVVSMLLEAESSGIAPDEDIRARITASIASSLRQEEHGHWVDFLMRKEGKNRAMPGNTRNYHRALLDYVTWQSRVLTHYFAGRVARMSQEKIEGSQ
jgi:hypothetical protein